MIPLAWLPWLKIGAIGVFLIELGTFCYRWGEKGVQADFDAYKAQLAASQLQLAKKHEQELADAFEQNKKTNWEISENYQRNVDELNEKYAAELASVRKSGGLRIPATACSNRTNSDPKTASTGGNNEASTGSIALPDQITAGLFQLTQEADQVSEQLRSCQGWIKKNGFYDEKPSSP